MRDKLTNWLDGRRLCRWLCRGGGSRCRSGCGGSADRRRCIGGSCRRCSRRHNLLNNNEIPKWQLLPWDLIVWVQHTWTVVAVDVEATTEDGLEPLELGGLVVTDRVGGEGRSTQHLIDASEQVTLSSTWEITHQWSWSPKCKIEFVIYLVAEKSGQYVNASSRTIFALGSGCDGIEETCNWLKEEEREKKTYLVRRVVDFSVCAHNNTFHFRYFFYVRLPLNMYFSFFQLLLFFLLGRWCMSYGFQFFSTFWSKFKHEIVGASGGRGCTGRQTRNQAGRRQCTKNIFKNEISWISKWPNLKSLRIPLFVFFTILCHMSGILTGWWVEKLVHPGHPVAGIEVLSSERNVTPIKRKLCVLELYCFLLADRSARVSNRKHMLIMSQTKHGKHKWN